MRRRAVLLLAVAALGLAACGSAQEKAAPPTAAVKRIVPLNGDIAEIVYALGLGAQVVGVDSSALYPAEAAAKEPKIGYQRELAAEGILSLSPTIVIGTADAGPPEVIDQIKQAGIRTEILPVPTSVDDVPGRIKAVAAALDVTAKGDELAATVGKELAKAKASGSSSTRVAFLYVRGPTTAMLGGQGTRAAAMIAATGFVDAGATSGVKGYVPITAEALVAAKPDVLVLLDGGVESVGGIEGVLKLPGVAQTPAGASKRIVSLEDTFLLNMGPRTGTALTELVTKVNGG